MQRISLIFAWTFVALPLAWGVSTSVQKALPLFNRSALAQPNKPPPSKTP